MTQIIKVADPLIQIVNSSDQTLLLQTAPMQINTGVSARNIVNISTNTTGAAANVDSVYICSGTFTYTQPTAIGNTSRYTIKNAGVGVITIVFTSGQNADGSTTITLNSGSAVDLVSNNTNWVII